MVAARQNDLRAFLVPQNCFCVIISNIGRLYSYFLLKNSNLAIVVRPIEILNRIRPQMWRK